MAMFPTDLETAWKATLELLTVAHYMDVTNARLGGKLVNRRSKAEV